MKEKQKIGIFTQLEKQKGSSLTEAEIDKVLEHLEVPMNSNGNYIDAFNKDISYNGIKTLKRPYTQLSLSPDHLNELEVCKSDIFYFVKYYCKILTKSGITRPEMRDYQNEFLRVLSSGDDTIASLPRQSGKSVTSGLYLLWIANFTPNINIGIAGNKLDLAMEVLDKVKKIFIELPMWMKQGIEAWNKTYIQFENGTRILTSATSADSFRGYSCHLLLIDEVAFVSSDKWIALEDSVFPAQDALARKQKILISTPNGMNHWYHLVTGANNNKNGYRYFSTDWKNVPRYNKDGTQKNPIEFKDEIIRKHGQRYFSQNYELEFLGSSNTLISAYALKNLEPMSDELVLYDTLFDGLRIFEEPSKNKQYIIGVDPNKDGVDRLAIQVIDVTELPFKQVASYNSNISYLNAPSKIFDLGMYYNNAMIIVENNIDNSIVDTLFYQYEYDGEIYKEKNKNILGFRTTKKTKKILLSVLKKLIEQNKLIIRDKKTIDELFVFIEQSNGTFSAQDGFHDDLVMSLLVSLAPFIDIKDFDDFKGFLKFIETDNELLEKEQEDMRKLFVGFSFSSEITDDDLTYLNKPNLNLY